MQSPFWTMIHLVVYSSHPSTPSVFVEISNENRMWGVVHIDQCDICWVERTRHVRISGKPTDGSRQNTVNSVEIRFRRKIPLLNWFVNSGAAEESGSYRTRAAVATKRGTLPRKIRIKAGRGWSGRQRSSIVLWLWYSYKNPKLVSLRDSSFFQLV